MADGVTLRNALGEAVASLSQSATARLDARLLLQHVTGLSHADLIGWPDHRLRADEADHLRTLVTRRASGEPVSQILGEKEFWGLSFKVTKDVLTPRPDSETLIELALSLCADNPPRRVLDLGTGSGCLLGALLMEFDTATGVGVDASAPALAVAGANMDRLRVSSRATLSNQDFADDLSDTFDLIVCNPPYIPLEDRDSLSPDVRDYEPSIALFAGPDGLDAYRALAHILPQRLAPGGIVVIEAGAGQAEAISAIMSDGFGARGREITITLRNDLAGIERAVGLQSQ